MIVSDVTGASSSIRLDVDHLAEVAEDLKVEVEVNVPSKLFRMEFTDVINTQFAFHGIVVGLVLICAVLVFVFGFKSVEEFPFDKLTNSADDRKPAGKKRKVKDKVIRLLLLRC